MPEFNSDSLVALFSVTKSYGEFLKNEASHKVPRERGLYEAIRGKWQISPEKRKEIKYAAAVYTAPGSRCEIVQVYRVHDWHTAGTSEKYKTRPELNKETPGFWEFDGTPADDVGKRLIGYRHSMSYEKEYKRLGELLNPSNTPKREGNMTKTAIELLEQFYQIIFHGPPGTGKTHCAKQLLPDLLGDGWDDRWSIVQFHPSYNYEDFVRGVQVETTQSGQVVYKTLNRTFGDMCANASKHPDEKFALIIDEINRANVSAVLGELIYALEYRGKPVNTPYAVGGEKQLMIPKNLYVIGTMNTADRTIGQIDYAVRRRFAFVACPPKREVVESENSGLTEQQKILNIYDDVQNLFRKTDNGFLSSDFDPADVCVGHSYFLPSNKEAGNPLHQIAQKIIWQVVPILREYVKDGVLQESATPEIDKIEAAAKKLLADEWAESDSSAEHIMDAIAKFDKTGDWNTINQNNQHPISRYAHFYKWSNTPSPRSAKYRQGQPKPSREVALSHNKFWLEREGLEDVIAAIREAHHEHPDFSELLFTMMPPHMPPMPSHPILVVRKDGSTKEFQPSGKALSWFDPSNPKISPENFTYQILFTAYPKQPQPAGRRPPYFPQ